MRVHHLNAVTTCPPGGALTDGRTVGLRARLACHCLLVETAAGLALVDTGLGLRDVASPRPRIGRAFLALLRPELRERMTAVRQVERLGFEADDVRHVVLTHLDLDHAGGLDDFPRAAVHLLADERDAAVARRTILDRMRYRPQQWASRERWRAYGRGEGEAWFGFEAVRDLEGLPPEILLVPLVGHTRGHAGVAVRGERGWLLHAGDAYLHRAEMDPEVPRCTPGLRLYQALMEKDRKARLWNRDRLRLLAMDHAGEVTVTCSHDPVEFERLADRPLATPAPPRYLHPVERPFPGEARP
ncbi:MAG TPA: MBL fold metallo-hydrolase [Anaeromyxobacter sp.]|nr:MBL fold metallo-hydrolase [Anaeromyxobacter sp.]